MFSRERSGSRIFVLGTRSMLFIVIKVKPGFLSLAPLNREPGSDQAIKLSWIRILLYKEAGSRLERGMNRIYGQIFIFYYFRCLVRCLTQNPVYRKSGRYLARYPVHPQLELKRMFFNRFRVALYRRQYQTCCSTRPRRSASTTSRQCSKQIRQIYDLQTKIRQIID